jgi:hypothetical protein
MIQTRLSFEVRSTCNKRKRARASTELHMKSATLVQSKLIQKRALKADANDEGEAEDVPFRAAPIRRRVYVASDDSELSENSDE